MRSYLLIYKYNFLKKISNLFEKLEKIIKYKFLKEKHKNRKEVNVRKRDLTRAGKRVLIGNVYLYLFSWLVLFLTCWFYIALKIVFPFPGIPLCLSGWSKCPHKKWDPPRENFLYIAVEQGHKSNPSTCKIKTPKVWHVFPGGVLFLTALVGQLLSYAERTLLVRWLTLCGSQLGPTVVDFINPPRPYISQLLCILFIYLKFSAEKPLSQLSIKNCLYILLLKKWYNLRYLSLIQFLWKISINSIYI